MSWCRWNSRCRWAGAPYAVDLACDPCPGSDVYVYESTDDRIVCCACRLSDGHDFDAQTEAAMLAHLLEHDRAGHHVRRSLLAEARHVHENGPPLKDPYDGLSEDARIDRAMAHHLTTHADVHRALGAHRKHFAELVRKSAKR